MTEQLTLSEFKSIGKKKRRRNKTPIATSKYHEKDAKISLILNVKALSVNDAFAGRRFRTPEYNDYINHVLYLLPKLPTGYPPYKLTVDFGLSSKLNDIDNGLKPFIDCLVKKYNFDDRDIYELNVKKIIVPKGKEYINFELKSI